MRQTGYKRYVMMYSQVNPSQSATAYSCDCSDIFSGTVQKVNAQSIEFKVSKGDRHVKRC